MEAAYTKHVTPDSPVVVDLTKEATEFAANKGSGLLSLFVPHATAALAIVELEDQGADALLAAIADILRPDYGWTTRHGRAGAGGHHIMPALLSVSLMIPVDNGHLALGEWQSIVLVDPNPAELERTVRYSFLAG